jgi:glycerate kinase
VPRVVAAPDKFRGTASAGEIALAVARAAAAVGWRCDQLPVSDGGEGFCEVLGGRSRPARVHGPLGEPTESEWRLLADGRTAVVEMALASGLVLVGGPEGNDPIRADTTGTGELIAEAVKAGARRVLVGMGGSATTDGGLGALDVLEPHSRLKGTEIIVACDVMLPFVEAAAVFAPQKGASPAEVEFLGRRLTRLAQVYEARFGIDVRAIPGSGSAGGLAGGLAAIGATLVGGFDVVAETIDLAGSIDGADLVVTGEGTIDEQSFNGKAVGGVVALAREMDVPVLVVAGDAVGEHPVSYETLLGHYGAARAMADVTTCVTELVEHYLRHGPR